MAEQNERFNAGSVFGEVLGQKALSAKALFLFVLNLVPVLNWVVPGAAIQWGKKAGYDRRAPLPGEPFADNAYLMGFYRTIYLALWCIVFTILLVIPLIGWAALAVAVPLAMLGITRMSLFNTFLIEFKPLWKALRRNMGSAMAAVWPPVLLFLAGIGVAFLVVFVVGQVPIVWILSDHEALVANGGLAWLLLAVVIVAFAHVFACLFVYRALGVWVGVFAPEWLEEAREYGFCEYVEEPGEEEEKPEGEESNDNGNLEETILKRAKHGKHAAIPLDDESAEPEDDSEINDGVADGEGAGKSKEGLAVEENESIRSNRAAQKKKRTRKKRF